MAPGRLAAFCLIVALAARARGASVTRLEAPALPPSLPSAGPAEHDYRALLERLDRAAENSAFALADPGFPREQLVKTQTALARELGLEGEPYHSGFMVSPEGSHRLNRWAARLESMGIATVWSPWENYYGRRDAYFDAPFLYPDGLAPVSSRPTPPLLHEFLHAWIELGPHRQALEPLLVRFYRDREYPQAEKRGYPSYSLDSFSAAEILTNQHTLYRLAADVARSGAAPAEKHAFELRGRLDGVLFLTEAVPQMAAALRADVAAAAEGSLPGPLIKELSPIFARPGQKVDLEAERAKDMGFYETKPKSPFGVRFPTWGLMDNQTKPLSEFPVFFGNGDYSAIGFVPMLEAGLLDFADEQARRAVVRLAAGPLAARLARLETLARVLRPSAAKLAALREEAARGMDAGLARRIRDEARAAFFTTFRHLRRRPTRASGPPRARRT